MKRSVLALMPVLFLLAGVQAAPPGVQLPDAMGVIASVQPGGVVVADQPFRIGGGTELRDSAGVPQPMTWLRAGMSVEVYLYPATAESREVPTARRIVETP